MAVYVCVCTQILQADTYGPRTLATHFYCMFRGNKTQNNKQ